MAVKYVHTNVIAKDWKKLAQFYIDVFGCAVVPPERNLSGEWVDALTGIEHCAIRGVHLALPGYENGPTLEIFSYEPKGTDIPRVIHNEGFAHIAFLVDDVEAMLQKLLAHGGSQMGGLVVRRYETLGELTVVYARDIEGNILELQRWS